MDEGHLETEMYLARIENRVNKVYRQAAEEVEKKLNDYLRRFKTKDQIKREQLRKGEITQDEYNYWRTGQIMIGKRWEEMKNTLAQDLHNSNNLARSIVQGYMPEVYAVNHNYATFQVEKDSLVDTSYTLYDRQTVERIMKDQPDLLPPPGPRKKAEIAAGKDIKWQRGQIQSTMMQSILQGESIPHIAQRMAKELSVKNRNSAVRYARTAATGAQNAGRVDGYKRAQGMGIELEQEWLATLDLRTRHEHRFLDGQHVPVGTPFKVDGEEIRFPGDPEAPGYLIWNCRCTLVPHLKNLDQSDAPRRSKLGDMSYEEWKNEHITTQPQTTTDVIRGINSLPGSDWFGNRIESSVNNPTRLAISPFHYIGNEESERIKNKVRNLTIDQYNPNNGTGSRTDFEEVLLSKLRTTQAFISRENAIGIYNSGKDRFVSVTGTEDFIVVAEEHGVYYILDGNHRLAIDFVSKRKKKRVFVVHI